MKRIISIALALVMVLSVAVVAVSAAEVSNPVGADSNNSAGADTSSSTTGSGDLVYFDASGWKNVTMVYCHIWKRGGAAFFSWQGKKEACKKVSGNKWSYDIASLEKTDQNELKGGLKSGEDYCIIFSAQTGKQTHDATFGKACIGDTLKLTGKQIENAVDSEKKADEAVWSKNSSSYGPHLTFTSIGNIVGSKLCPNENGVEVLGDWLPTYYKSNYIKDKVATVANALPKLKITSAKQIQDVYAYIISKKTGEDEKAMKKMLEDAFAKAYPAKKNEAKIDEGKAKNEAKQISSNGGHISSSSSAASSSSSSGGSSYSGSSSSNSSGSGSDGEEDTILFILLGVMLAAAGVIFVTRRKRTE